MKKTKTNKETKNKQITTTFDNGNKPWKNSMLCWTKRHNSLKSELKKEEENKSFKAFEIKIYAYCIIGSE